MKNLFLLIIIAAVIGLSILKGSALLQEFPQTGNGSITETPVPYIGRVQVLNGCGTGGVAHLMAEHLRRNHFDVKDIGNAENWNYPETLIISRVTDTTIASQVASALHSDNIVLIKNQESIYDVTVIVGPDYRERIQ